MKKEAKATKDLIPGEADVSSGDFYKQLALRQCSYPVMQSFSTQVIHTSCNQLEGEVERAIKEYDLRAGSFK